MNIEQQRTLLPCPFCGGKPRISKQMGESLWSHDIVLWTQVQCDECEAHVGPTCEGFEVEAVDIWNRRAALQPRPEVVGVTLDGCLETLFRVGEYLGIDYVAARKAPRAPSDVYIKAIEDRAALQSQDREDAFCVWHNDPETDNSWDTSCRQLFEIYDGTPTDNGMRFCCYCGKPIRQAIDHARRVEGRGNDN